MIYDQQPKNMDEYTNTESARCVLTGNWYVLHWCIGSLVPLPNLVTTVIC
jgi:hypothetical protein